MGDFRQAKRVDRSQMCPTAIDATVRMIIRVRAAIRARANRGLTNTMTRLQAMPTSTAPSLLTGEIMRSRTHKAIKTSLFAAGLLCCSLLAQVGHSQQDRAGGNSATSSVPAQPDAAVRASRPNATYVIGDDDVLAISVWKEPDISKQVTVRSDGKISLPLVGELQAAGRTPPQLEQDITARLRSYMNDPEVTVIVQQINSQKFNILGQVIKPGSYPLLAGTTILDAIATAGGFKDFAKRKDVYVLRENPGGGEVRIAFNYDKFVKGKNPSQNIQLKPHDTIVVP